MKITNRKFREEKLLQAEARYQAIVNAIPDMVFCISRDGEYLDFKGEYTTKEIVGKKLWEILPANVALIKQEAIAKTLVTNTLQVCEYQLSTPWGVRDYQARLVKSGENEVLAIVRDITEPKKTEIALQSLAQKFSKAFRCSPDPITISTLKEGRYIEVNESFVQLSGYQPSEVLGRTAFELNMWVNPSDRTKLLQKLQAQGAIRNQEIKFRKKSGEIIIVQVAAEVIELDGIPCLLAVSHDITERKQTEELLRLSAQRDRLLTETLMRIRQSLNINEILQTTVNEVREFLQADRVFIALNDSRDLFKMIAESVNPQYPSVLNWKKKDETLLQELRTKLLTDRVRVVEDITQTKVSPHLAALYQQFQTKASLAVPIMLGKELFGVLIANSCAKPRCWQQIEIDLLQQISEQLAIAIQQAQLYQELEQLNNNLERQVEERTAQLQQKMQELQEINRVKNVFLHAVSHDLRTTVMGNLMVLKNLLKSGRQGRRLGGQESNLSSLPPPTSPIPIPRSIIERMIQGNDRQLRMIDSLLEIHSTEVEGIILNQEIIQFNTFIGEVIKNVEPMLRQNQAKLKTLVAEDLPLVTADSVKLHQFFVDLFTYVLQTNPPGLDLLLTAKVEADMILCTVQFHGIHMSKLECDRLFELYVHEPQARFSTGIGLKMYLSRQLIKAHGGEIGVNSNHKCGVSFWFTLPLAIK
ncbi:PAS domain S-box protein [Fischerella thermalis]|uniref:sensor histidine kinase n=1 Tax=Fischerella thermalis TaxID=372787 RepID=UPI0019E353D5|nr:PAS domain S-box protein [Fischerella thermalis M58_A2018_009]MBF2058747.1 PAS domain S-box protein [Fischerella thermalis M66_A2018_004]MBF2069356.1 PAS domain S-box protein [Fischerella thermalis M48_A2018_028]